MSDDENKVTDINEGMKRINHDKLIAQMDEAGISVQAQNESLTSLELIDLREYVMRGGWKEDGGVVISIVESAGTKPTDVQAGRLAFHTFGKELVLRKNIVQLVSVTTLLSGLDRANAFDEDVWLDEYEHLLVTNFFSKGEEPPISASQRQRVVDYLQDRFDKGLHTHVQINGFKQKDKIDLSEWYGTAFWNWFSAQQIIVKI